MKKVMSLSAAFLALVAVSGCAVSNTDYKSLANRVSQEREINANLKSRVLEQENEIAKLEEANVRYSEALEKALSVQPTEVVVEKVAAPEIDVNDEISKLGDEIINLVNSQPESSEFSVVRASHAVGLRLDDGVELLFRPGSWALTANAKKSLEVLSDMISETLKSHPDYVVRVDGHTDADKIRKAKPNGVVDNTDLGYQRANTVRKFLVSKGIDESKLSVLSAGEWMPISSKKAQNRRVEIWVSTKDGFSFGGQKSDDQAQVSND